MLEALSPVGAQPLAADEVRLAEIVGLNIVSLSCSAPPDSWPKPGQSTDHAGGLLIRLGPDQCFWLGNGRPNADENIYTTDQSDSWAVLDLAGPACDKILERLCPLDLASWPVGSAGRTAIEHMSAIIVKIASDNHRLLSPRSSAGDFWHAVAQTIEDC